MAESPWPTIHAERQALASDLTDLTEQQWATPSLCADWTVHQALAHQVATAKMNPGRFLGKFASAGFSFERMSRKDIAQQSAGGPERTLVEFRALMGSTSSPPGPKDTWLGECLVHSEDIRRPLGIKREYPLPMVTRAIEFYSGSNAIIGGKTRVAGLKLVADDTTWSNGDGPIVEGPALSLLLAATGRKSALDDLTGPGVDVLRSR